MIKAITGTKDILPSEISRWHYLENLLRETFKTFNYKEIRTPIFEETGLFARGIGEDTDIVSKEMYTFKDRSETSITLRPENTAGVVRSFIEQSLGAQQSLNKLYYIGAMFRQERPQAGRLRQFHQFGAEALGSNSPFLDAEMIQIAFNILKNLGLKNLSVKINSIGTPDVREKYKFFLRKYLEDKKDKLSEESRKSFDTKILRIFDSKIEVDQQIMKDAPSLLRFLPDESIKDFEIVKNYLFKVGIPIEIDSTLVRGLDYYTLTTFEIVSRSVGSQSALCGGGRYDLLVQELGGKFTPGVGFAAGMERILLACENEKSLKLPNDSIDVYLIRINDDLKVKSEFELEIANLASNLRIENLSCDYDYHDRSVKAQMREANKFNAKFVVFVGGDEYTRGELNVKNLSNGEQQLIKINDFEKLKMLLKS
ncbi:MAG TPA: histidine--tRNA ligase [Ignavibacteriaceae bacterium]|nr:histidine--tRNA ligase [Ignavibacteriaceae bacterium]